ncbi:uncharacterized protein LOC110849624 isoform X2 [Folsomia candida]|uniref:uncharacterized protein LOC110849624 isoform X2 n=1 Tax=Folsomia candida TaxID=158441 RepID=UPI000B8F47CA|nr:uncharacterized protein LOC110849624 isoform X2 [Folsomia candida]
MKVLKTMYNPASGTKVAFGIRLGWHGNARFHGLEGLLGQTAIFDVNKTWQEAFKSHFGVSLDPIKYSVMRLWRDSGRLKHDPRELIKVMMKDFVKVQSSFVINIVENNKTLQANRIKDCSKYSQKTATPNGSTMTPNPFTAENQFYSSEIANIHGTEVSTYNDHRISTLVQHNLSVEQPSPSSMSHVGNPPLRVPPTIIKIRRPPVNEVYRQVSRSKAMSKTSKTKATSAISCQQNSHDDDDGDARSDITRASQDSQMEDLLELGIPYEDLKSIVCRKAYKNFSNIQFLQVKQEMQQFRKSNARRWARWTTTAPITTNILRELFHID